MVIISVGSPPFTCLKNGYPPATASLNSGLAMMFVGIWLFLKVESSTAPPLTTSKNDGYEVFGSLTILENPGNDGFDPGTIGVGIGILLPHGSYIGSIVTD